MKPLTHLLTYLLTYSLTYSSTHSLSNAVQDKEAALQQLRSAEDRYELKVSEAIRTTTIQVEAAMQVLIDQANATRDEYLLLYTKECKHRKQVLTHSLTHLLTHLLTYSLTYSLRSTTSSWRSKAISA